jgi:hypothetical protein
MIYSSQPSGVRERFGTRIEKEHLLKIDAHSRIPFLREP